MRKLFMAMVVVLSSSLAYAQTDGGVQQKPVAKAKVVTPDQIPSTQHAPATLPRTEVKPTACDGIEVNRFEALGFGMSYDTMIFVTGQVLASQGKHYHDFLDESLQMRIVSVLKLNDVIVKSPDMTSHCLVISSDDAYLMLKELFHMANYLKQSNATDQFDAFFLKLAHDEKTGMALIAGANSYTSKLAALAKTSPNFGK